MINSPKTVLYYHLYFIESALNVIGDHLTLIKNAQFDEVYIYAFNVDVISESDLITILKSFDGIPNTKIEVSNRSDVNEFGTLEKIYNDLHRYKSNDWIAYAHSKGVSHGSTSNASFKGKLLFRQLIEVNKIIKGDEIFSNYFDLAGSDLVVANFKDFGPPQVAFSGNFWMAKASHISKLNEISSNMKYIKSLRYHAEAWIGSCFSSQIFNLFSPARHHYDEHWKNIDELKLCCELKKFTEENHNYDVIQNYMNKIILYNLNRLERLYINFYPLTLNLRRLIFDLIRKRLIINTLLFRLVMSLTYRIGLLKSPLGLFSLEVPSQLTLSKNIK